MGNTTELETDLGLAELEGLVLGSVRSSIQAMVKDVLPNKSARDSSAVLSETLTRVDQELAQITAQRSFVEEWKKRVGADPEQFRDYLAEYDLAGPLLQTLKLAGAQFPAGTTWFFTFEGDGESEGAWLVVQFSLNASWADAYDIFDHFVNEWIDAVPPAARDRIRLNYSAR